MVGSPSVWLSGVVALLFGVDVANRCYTSSSALTSTTTTPALPPLVSLEAPVAAQQPVIAQDPPVAVKSSRKSTAKPRRVSRRSKTSAGWWTQNLATARWVISLVLAAFACILLDRLLRQFYGGLSAQTSSQSQRELRLQQVALDGADTVGVEDPDRTPTGGRADLMARARRVAASRQDRVLTIGN